MYLLQLYVWSYINLYLNIIIKYILRVFNCLGKTAGFMLPILERLLYRPTHTRVSRVLILTPTRELAIQVRGSIVAIG